MLLLALVACDLSSEPYVPPGCTLDAPVTFSDAWQLNGARSVHGETEGLYADRFALVETMAAATGCPARTDDGTTTTLEGDCETDAGSFSGRWSLTRSDTLQDSVMEGVVATVDGETFSLDGTVTSMIEEETTTLLADVVAEHGSRSYAVVLDQVTDWRGVTALADVHVDAFGEAPAGDFCVGREPTRDPDDPAVPDDSVEPDLTFLVGTNNALVTSKPGDPCEDYYIGELLVGRLCTDVP